MKKAFLSFCLICLFFGTEALAYQTHSSKNDSYKTLGKIQRVRMAQRLVSKLMDQPFFRDAELPSRVALSRLIVQGEAVPLTSTQLTDDVLNELLMQSRIIIVNQDFNMQIDSNYRLISYLTDDETRQKGVLMGADSYLQGGLQYMMKPNDRGKVRPSYRVELTVRDIRTNALVTQVVYEMQPKSSRNH